MRRYHSSDALISKILTDAGHTAGITPPAKRSKPYIVFFTNGSSVTTQVTDDYRIELEGWAQSPLAAQEELTTAITVIHQAVENPSTPIRHVQDAQGITQIPTGQEGWFRYVATLLITLRIPT